MDTSRLQQSIGIRTGVVTKEAVQVRKVNSVVDGQASDLSLQAKHVVLDGRSKILPLAEVEKQTILNALEQLNGNKLLTARVLGIGKTTLYRKLKEYGIFAL
jgi:two-component system response regulator HydG